MPSLSILLYIKRYVSHVVRTLMTLAFIIAATRVSWSIKSRVLRETTWQYELSGEKMKQRRIESLDKLLTVMTVAVGTIFALQAVVSPRPSATMSTCFLSCSRISSRQHIAFFSLSLFLAGLLARVTDPLAPAFSSPPPLPQGFDINSLLAIGGIGGIALGLAGREVLENLFNGLLILSTQPFEPGDEVQFRPIGAPTTFVEGIVIDVGWYRTTIRSFEREVFIIPNSTFSKTVILNVTRKRTEWRHLDTLYVDVKSIDDLRRVDLSIQDMRAIVRKEPRIIQKLHKRIFLDKLNNDGTAVIFFSLYVDAATKEAFMQVKQELMIQFVEVLQNNGLGLARKTVEVGADQPLVATTNYVPYIPQGAAMPQGRFFPPGAAAAPDRGSTGPAGAFNNTNDLSLYNVDDDALPPFRPPPPPPPHIPAMAASAAPPSAPVAAPPLEPERPRTPVDAAAAAVPSASAPSVPDAAPGPLPSVRGPPPSDVRRFDPEPVQNAEFSDARLSRSPDRGQAGSPTPRDGSPAAASAPSPSPEPAEAPGPSPTSPDAELYKVMYEELRRELGAIRSLLAAPPPALAPPPPPPPPPPSPPSPTPLMAVGGTVNVAKLVASFRQPDFTLEPWTEVPVKSTLFKEPTEELEPWAAMPAAAAAPESLSTPEDASAVAPAEPAASAPAPAAPSAPVFVEFALDSSEIPPVTAAAAAVAVALATARPASPAAVRGDDAEPTEIVFHFDASASTSAPASAAPAAADGPGVVIAEGPAPLRTAGAASPASPMPVPVPAAEVKAAIASAVERAEEQLAAAAGHAAEGVTSEPGAAHANGNGNGNGIGNGASSEAQAVVRVAGDGAALQPLGVAAAPEHELAAESAEGGEMVPAGTALSPKKGSGGFKDVE